MKLALITDTHFGARNENSALIKHTTNFFEDTFWPYMDSHNIESIILGFGINYKINPNVIEKKLKKSSNFYGIDSLIKDTKNENPINLMSDFLYEIEQNIEKLANGKKTQIIKEWTKKSETIGKKVAVNTLGGKISGMAKKIDGDGALILKTNDGIRRIFVGDIITT